jgi:hypothetical protein
VKTFHFIILQNHQRNISSRVTGLDKSYRAVPRDHALRRCEPQRGKYVDDGGYHSLGCKWQLRLCRAACAAAQRARAHVECGQARDGVGSQLLRADGAPDPTRRSKNSMHDISKLSEEECARILAALVCVELQGSEQYEPAAQTELAEEPVGQ